MPTTDRERWDAKYQDRGARLRDPAAWFVAHADSLPTSGRALDLAGGTGRHAVWLASRGLDVTLADVSPVGLALARDLAAQSGVTLEAAVEADLETHGLLGPDASPALAGPWDLVLIHHFLWRPLLTEVPRTLAPGGRLAFVHPTRTNLERHQRPSARYLLEDGELARLVAELPLEVLLLEEGWGSEGRHEARLIARA
jgi:tellurite methyltransferase